MTFSGFEYAEEEIHAIIYQASAGKGIKDNVKVESISKRLGCTLCARNNCTCILISGMLEAFVPLFHGYELNMDEGFLEAGMNGMIRRKNILSPLRYYTSRLLFPPRPISWWLGSHHLDPIIVVDKVMHCHLKLRMQISTVYFQR